MAKKMLLVAENELTRLRKLEENKLGDKEAVAFHLDEEISRLLQKKDLSEYEKAQRYAALFQKYSAFHQPGLPVPPQSQSVIIPPEPKSPGYSAQNIISSLPKRYQNRAESLLSLVGKEPDQLAWNNRGEIIVKGNIVPGSHIADLVRSVLVPKAKRPQKGTDPFAQALDEMNIPQGMMSNSYRESRNAEEVDDQPLAYRLEKLSHEKKKNKKKKSAVKDSPKPVRKLNFEDWLTTT